MQDKQHNSRRSSEHSQRPGSTGQRSFEKRNGARGSARHSSGNDGYGRGEADKRGFDPRRSDKRPFSKQSFGKRETENKDFEARRTDAGNGERRNFKPRDKERQGGFHSRDTHKPRSFKEGDRRFQRDGDKKPFARREREDSKKREGLAPRGERRPNEMHSTDRDSARRPFVKRREKAPMEDNKGVSLSRLSAFRVLQDVTVRGAYPSIALDRVLTANNLLEMDKRLATSIVYTTLENMIKIDYILDAFMEKPSYEPVLRDVLRMSAAQILFMDKIPDFAAINEGVKLIRVVSIVEAWSGVVNGVLRNILRSKDSFAWPKEEDGREQYLSIEYSIPLWLVRKLIDCFGYDEAKAIISYRKTDNRTCIRPNLHHISPTAFEALLAKKGWDYEKGMVPNAYLIKKIESIATDEDFRKGLFSVQGQSSMLAAMAVENGLGMLVLDACAAPGGKSFFMAEKQQGSGRIFAWDIHPHRVDLIREQMYRLNPGNVRVAICDAAQYREDLTEYFDRVLVDAPCSNLGVMFEKPDVKYNAQEEEMQSLLDTQYRILENCAKYLKVGGILVYSTCSILPEENYAQVEKFLQNNKNFSMLPMPDSFPPEMLAQANERGLEIFAHRSGLEGFYIARLRKNEA